MNRHTDPELKSITITLDKENREYIESRINNDLFGVSYGEFIIICTIHVFIALKKDPNVGWSLINYCSGEINEFSKKYNLCGKRKNPDREGQSGYLDSNAASSKKFRIGRGLSDKVLAFCDTINQKSLLKKKMTESMFYIAAICYCRDHDEPKFEGHFSSFTGLKKNAIDLVFSDLM